LVLVAFSCEASVSVTKHAALPAIAFAGSALIINTHLDVNISNIYVYILKQRERTGTWKTQQAQKLDRNSKIIRRRLPGKAENGKIRVMLTIGLGIKKSLAGAAVSVTQTGNGDMML